MKKYEKTVEEIAKKFSFTDSTVRNYLLSKEVADNSRVSYSHVKDHYTLRMIHSMPKKNWKEAVEYVMKNDTSQEDFDKKINNADIVEQKLEFVVGVILQ